uniref:Methyltransferase FkbM domain-containing protein n=1 Tax=Acrobeloides nanus TaxID=290746 RepID=A0A914EGI5_9BILA
MREIDTIYDCIYMKLLLSWTQNKPNVSAHDHKWNVYAAAFHNCAKKWLKKLDPYILQNREENKVYLKPLINQTTCNVITLGIGNDVEAEKSLKKLHPTCSFIGVDPDNATNQDLYEKDLGGKFIHAAVGGTGNDIHKLDPKGGGYYNTKFPQMEFKKFLKEYANFPLIDMIIIDAEFSEYLMLPILAGDSFM